MGAVSWMAMAMGLAAAAAAIAVLMLATLGISVRSRNWSVVDTFWGLGFVAVAVVSYLISIGHGDAGRRLIALLVPVVWGLRLAGYIHLRNHGKGQDPRYTALLRRRTGPLVPYVVKTIFWAQGWVMWVVAIPLTVAMFEREPANAVTWAGVALAAVGLSFEAVGDAQLARFKSDPANAGKIMDRGLWAWTRHPELLRRYLRDVLVLADRVRGVDRRGHGVRSPPHDPDARGQVGEGAARAPHDPLARGRLRRLRRPDQRADPATAPQAIRSRPQLGAPVSDLHPAVQALLDKSEIADLLTGYMRAIDRGDIGTLRSCYAPGATEEHGGIYAGPAQGYIDTIERALANPRLVATHAISNVLIDVAGDEARSEHYVLALTRAKADGVVRDSLVATRIIDELVRYEGRWAIARRRLRFEWAHDLGPRSQAWVSGTLDPATLLHGAKFPDDIVYEGSRGWSAS